MLRANVVSRASWLILRSSMVIRAVSDKPILRAVGQAGRDVKLPANMSLGLPVAGRGPGAALCAQCTPCRKVLQVHLHLAAAGGEAAPHNTALYMLGFETPPPPLSSAARLCMLRDAASAVLHSSQLLSDDPPCP